VRGFAFRAIGVVKGRHIKIMDLSHKLLLLAILGIIVWLARAVVRLLHRGMNAAQTGVRWREMEQESDSANVEPRPVLFLLSSVASVVKGISRFPWIQQTSQLKTSLALADQIADPIDGTIFQQGEPVVRCACGAAYHAHSWQWLAANNGGKCVSCKRAG
jgi:hypothetical protein